MIVEDSDVISYRGFEAVGCFGMQLSVEPACGLCGNHKPNRFFGIERKRIVGGLAYARPFFVFIIQATANGDAKCDYLCCSAFSKGERDYEPNQRPRAVLKKERVHIPTDTSIVILDKLDASCKE